METPVVALPDDPTRAADHGCFPAEAVISFPDLDDEAIVGMLCDLFAGRAPLAFGETIEWWLETCADLPVKEAAGALLPALSKWTFDHRAGVPGVNALRAALVARARFLIAKAAVETGEIRL
ncbi:hypothetical protein RAS12_13445 [Achromobacter seleniivolatilans]|uniref:Uncharacterized protein n=1 Tax=Achromobacter seleniivolatilans TaxID=3047478 RepID=A0ABY9M8M9_9BURK|nr:hypothetical protein [Achromobacter sp. R39]WMD23330.1 hypothetical protein RAS12_13445 [Achromobacter sp. R39]